MPALSSASSAAEALSVSPPPQDALVNVMRRARPIFLQCFSGKTDASGAFDVVQLRAQLEAAQTLAMLRVYRTGQRHAC